MGQQRRADIQWLRAIAAVSVVLWHTDLIVKHVWPDAELAANAGYGLVGGFGVELFFMLSGYSISMQVERLNSPREFLITRALRIYPLYWLFSSLLLLAYVINPGWPLSARAGDGVLFVLMSFLALPQEAFPLLLLGWTLELELVFYLLVATAMATGLLRAAKPVLGLLLVVLGLVGFAIAAPPIGGRLVYEIFSPYMVAFGLGWLLHGRDKVSGASSAGFVALAIAGLLALSTVMPEREAGCALRMALSAAVMALVMRLEPVFASRPALAWPGQLLGGASFSIYLSHWFVLSIIGKLLPRLPVTGIGSVGTRVLGVIVSVAVGIAVYRLIEEPMSAWISARRRARQGVAADPAQRAAAAPTLPLSAQASSESRG